MLNQLSENTNNCPFSNYKIKSFITKYKNWKQLADSEIQIPPTIHFGFVSNKENFLPHLFECAFLLCLWIFFSFLLLNCCCVEKILMILQFMTSKAVLWILEIWKNFEFQYRNMNVHAAKLINFWRLNQGLDTSNFHQCLPLKTVTDSGQNWKCPGFGWNEGKF